MQCRINAEVHLDEDELEMLFRKHMREQVKKAKKDLEDELAVKRGQVKHLEGDVADLKAERKYLQGELSRMREELRNGS